MIINLRELSQQSTESTVGEKRMRLSENAQSMVFQLFTKNIYSNPIGTVVREITSNCFDSHVEAGINSAVRIRSFFESESNTHYISFIDYGVGMSPDRVENIYGVYFESTKRVDDTQIGGFGIGGKTPLAYKRSTGHGEGEYDNSFYVITTYNGIKYYYCVYEGKESPIISLLHQEECQDHNGTEIRIPVLLKDLPMFEQEMIKQLYYFENVIFEGFEHNILNNNYTIVRGKNFLFRGTNYNESIHVCLGRVAYPIDYSVLGLNSYDYRIPVAIKLEIGEINVVASREQLDYNENTIKVLKKKLQKVVDEIKDLLSKQYDNIITLKQYFEVKHEFGVLHLSNGMQIKTANLLTQKDIDFSNFKYNFMKMPNDKQLFQFFFSVKTYGEKKRSRYSSSAFESNYNVICEGRQNVLYTEGEFTRKIIKQSYLREKNNTYYIISKRRVDGAFMRGEIADLFNVHLDRTVDENGKPVDFIANLIEMQDEYMDIIRAHAQNYDTLVVPEDFIANRKNKKNIVPKELREQSINIKFVGSSSSRNSVKLDKLFNYNGVIFYGTQEDNHKLHQAVRLFNLLFDRQYQVRYYTEYDHCFNTNLRDGDKKTVMFALISATNVKYMQYCRKAYHVNYFQHKMLYRKADYVKQCFQSSDIINRYNRIDNLFRSEVFTKIDSKWGECINAVSEYVKKYGDVENVRNLYNYKDELARYFDLSQKSCSVEEQNILKSIDDLEFLESANEDILSHISIPYNVERIDEPLLTILKKVMVL